MIEGFLPQTLPLIATLPSPVPEPPNSALERLWESADSSDVIRRPEVPTVKMPRYSLSKTFYIKQKQTNYETHETYEKQNGRLRFSDIVCVAFADCQGTGEYRGLSLVLGCTYE